jgi:ABC-type transport system involved in cytochrome bd biosynthesis fused ATPase/permease subunit
MLGALLKLFHTRYLGPNPTTVGILAAIIVIAQFHIKLIGSAGYVMASTAFALAPVVILHFVVASLVRGNAPSRPAQNGSEVENRF